MTLRTTLQMFKGTQFSLRCFYTYSKEPAMPLNRKPVVVSASEAMENVLKSDVTVFIQGTTATPIDLVEAMCDVAKEKCLENIKVCSMHTEGPARYTEKEYAEIFRSYIFYLDTNVRESVAAGYADSVPISLRDAPELFHRRIFKPDIALINVSPPNAHGFCSLGTSVDCVRAAITHSKKIVAQLNPSMPRTFGDSIIHVSHIDYAVKISKRLPNHPRKKPSPVEAKIGDLIAENLVENGATLQMGNNGITEAIVADLRCHKDLGIHTEMLSDGIIDLIEGGVVTNNRKKTYQGKTVASFLCGSQKLYEYFNDNPILEMKVIDYVNKASVIFKMPRMTAVNSCISMDLTGQVNSDSIGMRIYSGSGGQVDFIRGASTCKDRKGRAIIAFPSVNKEGESKIVPLLRQGSGIVTTRAHVHYIVTEYGIVDLFGKSLCQRAYALINIAHPDHRGRLMKAAYERYKVMPHP